MTAERPIFRKPCVKLRVRTRWADFVEPLDIKDAIRSHHREPDMSCRTKGVFRYIAHVSDELPRVYRHLLCQHDDEAVEPWHAHAVRKRELVLTNGV